MNNDITKIKEKIKLIKGIKLTQMYRDYKHLFKVGNNFYEEEILRKNLTIGRTYGKILYCVEPYSTTAQNRLKQLMYLNGESEN